MPTVLLALPLLQVPDLLRDFVVKGALPTASSLQDAAVVPTLLLGEAMQHLKDAAAASRASSGGVSSSSNGSSSSGRAAGGIGDSSSSGSGGAGISSNSENGF
jgi:hypothetical protein